MGRINLFFTYYGGKWRIAKHYPQPVHEVLIEPFAGSAGYRFSAVDFSDLGAWCRLRRGQVIVCEQEGGWVVTF